MAQVAPLCSLLWDLHVSFQAPDPLLWVELNPRPEGEPQGIGEAAQGRVGLAGTGVLRAGYLLVVCRSRLGLSRNTGGGHPLGHSS